MEHEEMSVEDLRQKRLEEIDSVIDFWKSATLADKLEEAEIGSSSLGPGYVEAARKLEADKNWHNICSRLGDASDQYRLDVFAAYDHSVNEFFLGTLGSGDDCDTVHIEVHEGELMLRGSINGEMRINERMPQVARLMRYRTSISRKRWMGNSVSEHDCLSVNGLETVAEALTLSLPLESERILNPEYCRLVCEDGEYKIVPTFKDHSYQARD